MSRHRCESCGGEYDDTLPDGMPYFHACPPVTVVRVRDDDGEEFEAPLRQLASFTLAASDDHRKQLVDAGADPFNVVVELGRRQAPRKDARDENTLRRDGDRGEVRVLKAEGKGRTPIAPSVAAAVAVDDAL